MTLLARRLNNTETVNTAEKEVIRPYRICVKRNQAKHAELEASTNDEFMLFVKDTYWKNRKKNIKILRKYYVSACYFLSSHHDLTFLEHVNSTLTCTNKSNN